jgi:hypothetical protein
MDKNKLKQLFSEDVQKVLSEETLAAIEQAFNHKVDLSVEAALLEQDEIYATKLANLIESIDKDHTAKMKLIAESIDKSNAKKLQTLSKIYEKANKKEAAKFKAQLVESISSYLDEYLKESLDNLGIEEAVKNKNAYVVLENLRGVLAVDSAVMKDSIKDAMIDGKKQIDTLAKENVDLKKKYEALLEQHEKMKVTSILEEKTAKFSEDKKKFVRKALSDKSPKFIEENFDYVSRLFDKQDKSRRENLKEEAIKSRKVVPDFVASKVDKKVIEEKKSESVNPLENDYLSVLSKGKGLM